MNTTTVSTTREEPMKLPHCGIVMPIAAMPNYEKPHWDRVRTILDEAITSAGFTPRLVSESENIGVIHARIVQNLYDDTIVVCDVSGKNANVMFELGLRLAFDKPTIVIKDDVTDYSFDTSPIEHINYRVDLRFDDVHEFKKRLADAIKGSVAKKKNDPAYSPFLGHFGKFEIAGLETKTVSSEQFLLKQMEALQSEVAQLGAIVANYSSMAEKSYWAKEDMRLFNEATGAKILRELEKNRNPGVTQHQPMLSAFTLEKPRF